MRTTILKYIEKNSRVDLGELAVLLGTDDCGKRDHADGEGKDYLRLSHAD